LARTPVSVNQDLPEVVSAVNRMAHAQECDVIQMPYVIKTNHLVQCVFVRLVSKEMGGSVLTSMNVRKMIMGVIKMPNVSTLWDPTTVPVNWGLKATEKTANLTGHAQASFAPLTLTV